MTVFLAFGGVEEASEDLYQLGFEASLTELGVKQRPECKHAKEKIESMSHPTDPEMTTRLSSAKTNGDNASTFEHP